MGFSRVRQYQNTQGCFNLTYSCAIFNAYCFPCVRYFSEAWVAMILLIDDWS